MPMTEEGALIEDFFRIANKDGEDVDFLLNSAQLRLDEGLCGRDLVPKARQEGVSSYFLARYTAACLVRRNVRAVVISHDTESTQRMLKKVKYYLEHLRGPKAVIGSNSANEISFPKTDSTFYIGTAGSRKFGRGDTITHLHCSEYAYWPNPQELAKGLFQAVPLTGEIAIESTGNGLNDYYKRCVAAEKGQSEWRVHFLPWHNFPEYNLDLTDEESEYLLCHLDEDWEEPQLVGVLTPGQIAWRRRKLAELNYDLRDFKQEYPMTLDECFQASGESIFYKVRYEPTNKWTRKAHDLHILDGHPNPELNYILGVDSAAGVGKDSSVVEIYCLESLEQVGEFVNNKIPPDFLAGKIVELASDFGQPYVVVEQNNHGLVTLSYLRDIYPPHLIHKDKLGSGGATGLLRFGFKTTQRSKPIMIGALRKYLAETMLIHSPILYMELSTFIEHEGGELGAADGCHDDTVIASACIAMGIEKAGLFTHHTKEEDRPKEADFVMVDGRLQVSFDALLHELEQRLGRGFPISPQHASSLGRSRARSN